MKRYNLSKKLEEERVKFRVYCSCGHSLIFPKSSKANKIICSHCGHYIYKNDLEKFKDSLTKKKREVENAKRYNTSINRTDDKE